MRIVWDFRVWIEDRGIWFNCNKKACSLYLLDQYLEIRIEWVYGSTDPYTFSTVSPFFQQTFLLASVFLLTMFTNDMLSTPVRDGIYDYAWYGLKLVLRKIVILPRDPEGEEFEDISLDDIFAEDNSDVAEDASDSDGFLSEVLNYILWRKHFSFHLAFVFSIWLFCNAYVF